MAGVLLRLDEVEWREQEQLKEREFKRKKLKLEKQSGNMRRGLASYMFMTFASKMMGMSSGFTTSFKLISRDIYIRESN